jgi:hypothetical protein
VVGFSPSGDTVALGARAFQKQIFTEKIEQLKLDYIV